MSDIKGLEISDILGLAQPLTKLIETISCGIGKVYEPLHIKRLGKARAEEIRSISDALNENILLPVNFNDGIVSVDTNNIEDLVKRAQNRFLFQEIEKQQNIESTISIAYNELEQMDTVSEQPVDKDWISRFFNCVEDISDIEMQKIWGKILAGEIKQPKSFSKRTLDVIKNLSQQEALLFEKLSKYVLYTFDSRSKNKAAFVISSMFSKRENTGIDIAYGDILTLKEAGLVSLAEKTVMSFELEPSETDSIFYSNIEMQITNNSNSKSLVVIEPYILTEAGRELFEILYTNSEVDVEYIKYLEEKILNSSETHTKNDFEINIIEAIK